MKQTSVTFLLGSRVNVALSLWRSILRADQRIVLDESFRVAGRLAGLPGLLPDPREVSFYHVGEDIWPLFVPHAEAVVQYMRRPVFIDRAIGPKPFCAEQRDLMDAHIDVARILNISLAENDLSGELRAALGTAWRIWRYYHAKEILNPEDTFLSEIDRTFIREVPDLRERSSHLGNHTSRVPNSAK